MQKPQWKGNPEPPPKLYVAWQSSAVTCLVVGGVEGGRICQSSMRCRAGHGRGRIALWSQSMDAWLSQGRTKKRKVDDTVQQHEPVKRTKSENETKPRPQQKSAISRPDSTKTAQPDKPDHVLVVTEEEGDIFDAPPNTLIIHACNCDGSWGGGIALAFKKHYPDAYGKYAAHCKRSGGDLVNTAYLIPPQAGDDSKHFVGCLFTSRHYGRRKDSPTKILAATKPAMLDLLKQVKEFNAKADEGDRVNEVRICKINSGLFKVPWAKTRTVLEGIDVSAEDVKELKVVSPEE
ncbi:ADP-ribose 1''-phosphate phosphatase [Elasticomyces elasticus]|nr:ADP-ribose 1''-phosphate phosphatase [Elasticomyces elasticus]KAK3667992.1 ADP-ribose 1''-phosphate phosphatase [Elasticomyces elasticus]KAK4925067.1 ADP-ribose 1''-phosphate phosphatase [Elasticomyces elasticus]KAK5767632.1 ADP-ribose 1''-phosphate phosphatase [Elasticomyces elasticus]